MASKTNRSASSTSTSNRSFVRGSKTMNLEDAICVGLAQTADGLPGGDGLSLSAIAEAVQSDEVGYTFAGNPNNHTIIVNQRLGELREDGYVRQAKIPGRTRGMPYLLTPKGRNWVNKAVAAAAEAEAEAVAAE